MNRSGRRYRAGRRWLIAGGVVAIVLGHLVILARLLLSPEQFRRRAEAALRRLGPGEVKLGDAEYRFPAGFRLTDIDVTRSEAKGGGQLLRAKSLEVTCRLWPLLWGEVAIGEVLIEEPEVFITAADLLEAEPTEGEPARAEIDRVVLRGGRLRFGEGVLFPRCPEQELRDVTIELGRSRRLENGYSFEGEASSDLWGRCTIEGTLDLAGKRLDAAVVARRVKLDKELYGLLPKSTVRVLGRYGFRGEADLTVKPSVSWGAQGPQLDLAAEAELIDCEATWREIPVPCTDIRGRVDFDGADLTYHNIQGRAGPASVTLNGRSSRRKDDVVVAVRGCPLDAGLRDVVAKSRFPNLWERYGIQSTESKGTIDVDVHSVWRRAERRLEADMTIHVRDVTAEYPRFRYKLFGIEGTFKRTLCGWMEDGKWRQSGTTRIVSLKGRRSREGSSDKATLEIAGGEARDDGYVDMTVHIRDVALDDEHKELYNALPEHVQRIHTEFNPTGPADISCTIKGPTRKPAVPEYGVVLEPKGASFCYNKLPYPVPDVRGTIHVAPARHVKIDDLRGRLPGKGTVQITGEIPPDDKLDVTIRAFDLSFEDDALYAALPDHVARTRRILSPTGGGDVTCRIRGSLREPTYHTEIEPEGASFRHSDFPHRIDDVRGKITVAEDGRVTFTDLKGRLGTIPLAFRGSIIPGPKLPVVEVPLCFRGSVVDLSVVDITAAAAEVGLGPAPRQYLNANQLAVYDQLAPEGKAAFVWRLTHDPLAGPPRQTFEIRCAQECSIRHRQFPIRIRDLSGRIVIEGSGKTNFTGVRGRIGDASVEAVNARYDPAPDDSLRFTLRARRLAFTGELRAAIPAAWDSVWKTLQPSGVADVEYQFTSNRKDPDKPLQRISIKPRDAAFTYTRFPIPVTDVASGEVSFDQDGNTTISDIQGKARGQTVRLAGKVAATSERSILHLDIWTEDLALDDELRRLLPKDWQATWDDFKPSGTIDATSTVTADVTQGTIQSFRLKARLKGGQATYAKLPLRLTGLSGTVDYRDGVATFDTVVGHSPVAERVRLDGCAPGTEANPCRLRIRVQNARFVPELLAALPKDVCTLLQTSKFTGGADADLRVELPEKGGAIVRGTIPLRNCSFHTRYDFEQVTGDLVIEEGRVEPKGGYRIEGTLDLSKLVARKLLIMGAAGHYTYETKPPAEGQAPAASLRLAGVQGNFYGGRLSIPRAAFSLPAGSLTEGSVLLSNVDFKEFCSKGLRYDKDVRGTLGLRMEFPPGRLKDQGLDGDGTAHIERGQLGALPLAAAIFDVLRFKMPERSITKAELTFGLHKDKIVVKELLLGREGWLTKGEGTAGFDKTLDLRFKTPKASSIIDISRLFVNELVEINIRGTIDKPETGRTFVPVTKRAFGEFKKLFQDWEGR